MRPKNLIHYYCYDELTFLENDIINQEGNLQVTLDMDGEEMPILSIVNNGTWNGTGYIAFPKEGKVYYS